MKKVCIIIITLMTTITMTFFTDSCLELLCLSRSSLVFYIFGFYLIRRIEYYFYKKKFEDDIKNILDEDFLLKVKKELTLSKIKNELKKISNSELRTDQSEAS